MAAYLVRRVLWIIPVLFGIATITFFLMQFVPGGPWDSDKPLDPRVVENLNLRYGLDDPLWEQYGRFLADAIRGDLGVSYTQQGRKVTDILWQGLPTTATLAAIAFLLAVAVGIPLGMAAAIRQDSMVDYLSVSFATIFASIPGFVLGIVLVVLFSLRWDPLPSGGWGSPSEVVLPAIALAALPAAFIARVTRASMLDVLQQEYVLTATAKGLSRHVVIHRHALRNALIPILTIMGPELAALVTGSFIIETVFSVPGIGRLFVLGVFQRDYGVVMGMVLFYAFVISVLNLAVDLLYPVVDPRVRYR